MGIPLEKERVTITADGVVDVKGYIRGYVEPIPKRKLYCDGLEEKTNPGTVSITMNIIASTSRKTCVCQASKRHGEERKSEIYFENGLQKLAKMVAEFDRKIKNGNKFIVKSVHEDRTLSKINDVIMWMGKNPTSSTPEIAANVLTYLDKLTGCCGHQLDRKTRGNTIESIELLTANIPLDRNRDFNFVSEKISLLVLSLRPVKHDKLSFRGSHSSNNTDVIKRVKEPTKGKVSNSDVTKVNVGIPLGAIKQSVSNEDRHKMERLAMVMYHDHKLFRSRHPKRNEKIISHVFSIGIPGISITDLNETINLTFQHEEQNTRVLHCAFWNLDRTNEIGLWDTKGCSILEYDQHFVKCGCTHLSHFALMIVAGDSVLNEYDNPLEVISLIGCAISVICLSLTLTTYAIFPYLRMDNPSKILMELCTALLLSNIAFIANSITSSGKSEPMCRSTAMFLHYSMLSALLWMACDAYYLYVAMVKVFMSEFNHILFLFRMIAWGLPIVALLTTTFLDSYGRVYDNFCWIARPVIYYVFHLPVGLVMFYNYSVFGVVVRCVKKVSETDISSERKKLIQKQLKGAVSLASLLGLTWLFGFFARGVVTVVFGFLFVIFNTLQGCFIFVFYCALKPKVRDFWNRMYSRDFRSSIFASRSYIKSEFRRETNITMIDTADNERGHSVSV